MVQLIKVQFEILQKSPPKILGELGQSRHSPSSRLLHCIPFSAKHFPIYNNCGLHAKDANPIPMPRPLQAGCAVGSPLGPPPWLVIGLLLVC